MDDIFTWIQQHLQPQVCTTDRFLYDDMDSQSGYCLPIIYQPFDANNKAHWNDRGAAFDYLFATQGQGKRVLDFGPGDGWPSLIVAPYVGEVVGVDGSQRRVHVCQQNAERLKITNARFIHVPPGEQLPFPENSFDGVMAASSIEQSPDPKKTLEEIYRVLKPGGRLRVSYEALNRYRSGLEREVYLTPIHGDRSSLILFDRDIPAERVVQYGLVFDLHPNKLIHQITGSERPLTLEAITITALQKVRPMIVEARVSTTVHPSGRTYLTWLREIGFREVWPTHNGMWMAERLFENWPEGEKPADMAGVDRILRPIIRVVVNMPAPVELDPMITAVK